MTPSYRDILLPSGERIHMESPQTASQLRRAMCIRDIGIAALAEGEFILVFDRHSNLAPNTAAMDLADRYNGSHPSINGPAAMVSKRELRGLPA